MVKTMAVTLNVAPSQLDEFSMCVLNETCSTVANCASRTVVQLVFGVANLVHDLLLTERTYLMHGIF